MFKEAIAVDAVKCNGLAAGAVSGIRRHGNVSQEFPGQFSSPAA
jgi:hypothetical protein